MPQVVCPTCGAEVFVTEDMLGKPVACGGCGQAFVPEPERDEPRRLGQTRYGGKLAIDEDDDDDGYYDPDDRPRYPERPRSDLGVASMVIGIVSIPMVVCCPYLMLPAAVLAVILGVLGLKTNQWSESIIGIATGGLSMVIGVVGVVLMFFVFASAPAPMAPAPVPAPVAPPPANWPPRTFR